MKTTILILGLVLFSSCTKKTIEPNPGQTQASDVEVTEIQSGSMMGAGEENIPMSRMIITNQVELDSIMIKMNLVNPHWVLPYNVDFSEYQVLAAFAEVKPTGGWSIAFTNVSSNGSNITATAVETGPGDIATFVITQPYTFIKIPVSNLPVIFN